MHKEFSGFYQHERVTVLLGDCHEQLKTIEPNSIDALVTDPPAGISFMGKSWDSDKGGRLEWIKWMSEVMRECLRVMKPGAHGLVWAIPRTSHWTATALEEAGFEIRDVITHHFGSGFPKSLDVSKAIDKAAGVERPSIPLVRCDGKIQHNKEGGGWKQSSEKYVHHPVFEGSNEFAKQWQGWGTALKPASEHWILVRKPCSEKTVAANVIKWGTGGINIDATRIEPTSDYGRSAANSKGTINAHEDFDGKAFKIAERNAEYASPKGRFPSNLVLSHSPYCKDDQCDIECPIAILDAQSGQSVSRPHKNKACRPSGTFNASMGEAFSPYNDHGGASRFFYCAKVSPSERNAGCDELPDVLISGDVSLRQRGVHGQTGAPNKPLISKNHHPTVKPKKLMSYLIKLITPPSGVVLDPFMGSGSTGIAAKENGFSFIGIEKEVEYFEIAKNRINAT